MPIGPNPCIFILKLHSWLRLSSKSKCPQMLLQLPISHRYQHGIIWKCPLIMGSQIYNLNSLVFWPVILILLFPCPTFFDRLHSILFTSLQMQAVPCRIMKFIISSSYLIAISPLSSYTNCGRIILCINSSIIISMLMDPRLTWACVLIGLQSKLCFWLKSKMDQSVGLGKLKL